jgi:hypothetical protein
VGRGGLQPIDLNGHRRIKKLTGDLYNYRYDPQHPDQPYLVGYSSRRHRPSSSPSHTRDRTTRVPCPEDRRHHRPKDRLHPWEIKLKRDDQDGYKLFFLRSHGSVPLLKIRCNTNSRQDPLANCPQHAPRGVRVFLATDHTQAGEISINSPIRPVAIGNWTMAH